MTLVRFLGTDCSIQKRYYGNGRVALQLIDEEDGSPIATATVNLPDVKLGLNQVAIKSYSECEGLLESLIAAGVVKPTGQVVRSGFVEVPVCELQPPFREPEQGRGRGR